MLITFKVDNFLSYQCLNTFSLANKQGDESSKVNVIYGVNASGKTNFFQAIHALKLLLKSSHKNKDLFSNIVQPFALNANNIKQPSLLEMTFVLDHTQYRYGFEIGREQVIREWFFDESRQNGTQLFKRNGNKIEINYSRLDGERLTNNRPYSHELLLSAHADCGGALSKKVLDYLQNQLFIIWSNSYSEQVEREFTEDMLGEVYYYDKLSHVLRWFDAHIDAFIAVKRSRGEAVSDIAKGIDENYWQHNADSMLFRDGDMVPHTDTFWAVQRWMRDEQSNLIEKVLFNVDVQESEGLKKMFSYGIPLYYALQSGSIFMMDNPGCFLHPSIIERIIQLFNNKETNPKGAQFIFSTRNSRLLQSKQLSRSQIWITEKNKDNASFLYPMTDLKDAAMPFNLHEQDYWQGKFGKIWL